MVFSLTFDRLTNWEEETERDARGLQGRRQKKKKTELSSNGVRRLALRGGVKRIQKMIMPHLKLYMKLFVEQVLLFSYLPLFVILLSQVVKDAIVFAEYENKNRITATHFVRAMKRISRNVYM